MSRVKKARAGRKATAGKKATAGRKATAAGEKWTRKAVCGTAFHGDIEPHA